MTDKTANRRLPVKIKRKLNNAKPQKNAQSNRWGDPFLFELDLTIVERIHKIKSKKTANLTTLRFSLKCNANDKQKPTKSIKRNWLNAYIHVLTDAHCIIVSTICSSFSCFAGWGKKVHTQIHILAAFSMLNIYFYIHLATAIVYTNLHTHTQCCRLTFSALVGHLIFLISLSIGVRFGQMMWN